FTAADLDGDGDIDFVSAYQDAIFWHENNGSESFTRRTISTNTARPLGILAADLDADGDIDIATASANDSKVAWFENDGSESFTLRTVSVSASFATGVFAADVDDDGDLDLLSSSFVDDKIAWYENEGGQFLFSGSPQAIPAGLFDGDTVELLDLQVLHAGRSVDGDLDLDLIPLQLLDPNSLPLNSARARKLIADLRVYLDDGDGLRNAGDTLISSFPLLLTPEVFTHGIEAIPISPDGLVRLQPGESARLFIEGDLAADASAQDPGSFQAVVPQSVLGTPLASDSARQAQALSLAFPMNVASEAVQPLPNVNLAVSATEGTETETTQVTVTAAATGPVSGVQVLDIDLGGTAMLTSDYVITDDDTGEPGIQIEIPDGLTEATLTLEVVDDDLLEGAETVTLTLNNPSAGVSLGSTTVQEVTIIDNDSASISIADVTLDEGDSGTTVFTFTTTLTGAADESFTVDYSLAAGSATAGVDYTDTFGTLNFTGSDAETKVFTVDVVGDSVVELDENFTVNLTAPTNPLVTLADGQASGTLANDDAATLSIKDVTSNEGNIGTTSFDFTVTLNAPVDNGISVNFATMDGTATVADGDYNDTSGTLTFAGSAGEVNTITVPVSGDVRVEPDESFTVELSNIQANARNVTFADATGTGAIDNDDAAEIGVQRGSVSIADGATDDLGFVQLGTASVTYTVNSTGNATAEINPPSFSNLNNVDDVALAVPPEASIPGGSSTSFDVSFNTLGIGPFSFDLKFENNDANENPYNITVTGDVPSVVLSSELAPPILLVDNDSDGKPNPSDTARFGVLLRNDGEPASGELQFMLTAPNGTTVL
ncbi:MAG: Calx-beta domain-containing protein, partial [Rhodothermales bacterium]|nr:Calx-beta domain-containing protein [Rhodothermales bacterium]